LNGRGMRLVRILVLLTSGIAIIGSVLLGGPDPREPRAVPSHEADFFELRIRPVLAKNCYNCHGQDQQLSALRVDSREALLKGGKRGPAIIPGDPDKSLLVKAIRHDELKMPVGSRLRDIEISAVEQWIRNGANWPAIAAGKVSSSKERYSQLAQEHWAFQRVKRTKPPAVNDSAWSENEIDQFILARLNQAGLRPARPADKRILMRRLNYLLIGLPPTPEELDRFAADTSPNAYEQLVDRVLASPHFGEHWARHWLDLVRFGETRGYEWNYEIIGAWRYRDYLVRAFNSDVPYNQLVREHIAGDLLEAPRLNIKDNMNESVIGTAFYRLGEAGHDDCIMFREIALDVMDNEIDTLTKTFQGLTVSCARCHDHKLDPIPTTDYYGLYSILNSSRVVSHTIDLPQLNKDRIEQLRKLKDDIGEEIASIWKREARQTSRYMLASLQPSLDSTEGDLDAQRVRSWTKALYLGNQDLDDPSYPWAALLSWTESDEKYLAAVAGNLVVQYRRETVEREAFNRSNFKAIGDFRTKTSDSWAASGNGLIYGYASSGDFTVEPAGERVVKGILPRGQYTNLISARLNGALRSPDLPKDKKFISIRVMGGNLGARRTVIDNCAIGENYKVLENEAPTWVKLDSFAKQQRLPVFVELVTRSDNPRLPDRPEVLKPHQKKMLDDPRSYFGITAAVLHDVNEPPKETLSHILPLFEQGAPSNWRSLADSYRKRIEDAVDHWSAGTASDDDVRWLDWLARNDLLPNRSDTGAKLQKLLNEFRQIEGQIPPARVVEGLADKGQGTDFPVLVGGDAKTFGEPAPRRFLKNIFGETPFADPGSGRRELAKTIASPDNPLTARLMVNRIWRHIFGRGIVASVDNFGVIGDKPTHPELLDYLAAKFVEQGWSIKKMIRMMVLSEAFRQSGDTNAKAREQDPQNELLHHYPLRRLEAESIRDSILMTSGRLKPSMFGPSTDPYRDKPQEYRRLFSGPLDGEGRRSLYLKVTRMEGSRLLEAFDYPPPLASRGARDVTNVPAQALTLLNDPLVTTMAEECARRLLNRPAESVDARVEALFFAALGRRPSASERERFRGLAAELASLYGVPREELLNNLTVWKDLAHTVFNSKEFIYIQ
jgi:hypothetical protein